MSTLTWTLLLLAVAKSVFGRWQYNQLRCNDILSSIFGGGQQQSAPAPTANFGALPSAAPNGGVGSPSSATGALPPLAPVSSASNAGLPSASALGIGTKTPAPAGNTLAGLANQ